MAGIGYTICGRYFNTVFGQMNLNVVGGSTGLVVMGGDSHSKGGGFTLICCKNCIVCLEKTENKQKRGRGWPIF